MDEDLVANIDPEILITGSRLAFAEASPLPTVLVDGFLHIVRYVNPAFCSLVNKSRDLLIGNTFDCIVPAGIECLTLLNRVASTGEAETNIGRDPSSPDPLYWSYVMWPMLGKKGHAIGTMIQVTKGTLFHEPAIAMNEALMLGSIRQHELTAVAEKLNTELRREIAERENMELQLRESERNLSALVEQKGTLVQEIHHRVKNNLQMVASLLSLHAQQTDDPRVTEALAVAGGRVQVIGRLHETLYGSKTLAEINFGEYLHRLTDELQGLHSHAGISVQVLANDVVLSMDTAIPLGLVANELILNCFKHAFPEGRGGRVIPASTAMSHPDYESYSRQTDPTRCDL